MKTILNSFISSAVFALMLFSFGFTKGQIPKFGGPDSYGYTWYTSDTSGINAPTYSWLDISSYGTEITGSFGDDVVVGPFDIGFDFPYYWSTESQFSIGSNGYIHFGTTPLNISSGSYGPGSDESFMEFPYNDPEGDYNNLLAPFLTDLYPIQGNGAKILYYTNNKDSLIISFHNVEFWDNATTTSGSNTFQVILSKADSSILFQYNNQSGNWDDAYLGVENPMVIGIESTSGIAGLTVSDQIKPTSGLAIKFKKTDATSLSITDFGIDFNQNIYNGGSFAMVDRAIPISTFVTNKGNETISSTITVDTKVEKYTNGTSSSLNIFQPGGSNASFEVSDFLPGDTIRHVYSESLIPKNLPNQGEPGTYLITSSTSFTDDNSNNDEALTELVILDSTRLDSINLSYHDGSNDGLFSFGKGGVYFDVPFAPVVLNEVQLYTVTDGNPANFGIFLKIFEQSPSGSVGNEVYSTYISSGSITYPDGITYVSIPSVDISTSGFYVSFELENGLDNYYIAEDNTFPFSNRNYEISAGIWGAYRSNNSGDLMINAVVDGTSSTYSSCVRYGYTLVSGCDSVSHNSNWYKEDVIFYDTMTTASCDSVVETEIKVKNSFYKGVNVQICEGDSIFINGAYRKSPGIFTEMFTAPNGCDSVINTTLALIQDTAICNSTGIIPVKDILKSVELYPNPVYNSLNIDGSMSDTPLKVDIFNIYGGLEASFNINPNSKLQLNMKHFSSGTYFVKLSNDTNFDLRKIIVY